MANEIPSEMKVKYRPINAYTAYTASTAKSSSLHIQLQIAFIIVVWWHMYVGVPESSIMPTIPKSSPLQRQLNSTNPADSTSITSTTTVLKTGKCTAGVKLFFFSFLGLV